MIAPNPFFVNRGFGVLVLEQARALKRRGIHVEVVAYHTGQELPDLTVHRTLPFPGYSASKIGPSLSRLPLWVLLLVKTFLVARRMRPDVLHGHLHEGALIAAIVARLTGIPWVFDFQGSLTLEMAEKGALRRGSMPFRAVAFVEGMIDRRALLIFVKSQLMENDLVDRFRVDATRILRVMDGADPDIFSPREADAELRRQLGIDEAATVICYLGLLTLQQGTERLLAATAQIVKQQPNVHMLIIGYPIDGWDARARELGIERHVTFTGQVDHHLAPEYLAVADLAAAPKVSDAEGNVKVYDYMSMALPVVAIDSTGNRELLGDDGYYVTGHEPDDFARGVMAALAARGEWQERGERLRTRIVEELSWDSVAARLNEGYRDVSTDAFADGPTATV